MPGGRTWRTKAALVAGSTLFALLLFEGAVRLFHLPYNLSPNWRYHPVLGWSQVPGAMYDQPTVPPVHISFNRLGFRDRNHAVAKPPGRRRIVVIGDSFCEALQVNLEDTFHQVLQARLNQGGGDAWEVINLGVGDFGQAQELLALTHYGLAYQPDVVIQEIFPLNDVCNDSLELFGACKSDNDRYRPYAVERDGALEVVSAQPLRAWLRDHSASWGVTERVLVPGPGHAAKDYDRRVAALGLAPLGPLLGVYQDDGDQPAVMRRAWAITERTLAETAHAAWRGGAAYLPMVVPFEGVVGTNREPFSEPHRAQRFRADYPETRLRRFFGGLGIQPVLLAERFDRAPEVLPYIDGHFNVAAHRLAAEALYDALVRRDLVGPRPDPVAR